MELWRQLLPFALAAATAAGLVGIYAFRSSQMRRRMAASRRAKAGTAFLSGREAQVPQPATSAPATPGGGILYRGVTIPEAVPTSQITRLHKLGIAPKQIATVLERPSQEVEIVLMVEKTRRIGLIPNPCGKLSGAVDGTPVRAASNSPAEAPF